MRKIIIGLVSFAAVGVVFILYSLIDRTPTIETEPGIGVVGVADSNFGRYGDANSIGKIGDVGVGTVEKSYYVTRDENNEISGEFGFEVLLHKEGDVWELRKPYRNIYQPDFKCYMTADEGSVRVETAAGSTTPKDATFSGNVVIHIVPEESSDIKECTIYLDDLVFLSDMSQLATDGPVTVVSQDIQMLGVGMKLIYNDVLNRLELFRIFELKTLVIKLSQTAFGTQERTVEPAGTDIEDTGSQSNEPAVAADSKESQQQYYKCLFNRNVLIDAPEQLVYADREVIINDIFWSKGKNETGTPADTSSQSDANEPVVAVADSSEPNELPEQLVEVTITCDDGMIIMPKDLAVAPEGLAQVDLNTQSDILTGMHEKAAGRTTLITHSIEYSALRDDTLAYGPTELRFYAEDSNSTDPNQIVLPVKVTAQKQARFLKTTSQVIFEGDCLCTMPQRDLTEEKEVTLSAPQIAVNLPENGSRQRSALPDMTAAGPAELVFYVEDSNAPKAVRTAVPVTITAQKQARFISETNEVTFEGDSLCRMGSEEISKDRIFTLKSPKLTVKMPKEKSEQSFALTDIVADGPAELDFYIDDLTGTQGPNEPLPAKVLAQGQARFLSASKQIVFDGSCSSTILREDPNFLEEFTLLSEKMTVDLPEDANDRLASSQTGIKHLAAEGGVVTLAALKKAKAGAMQAKGIKSGRKLGGIEIKCNRIDYSSLQQLFLATGPALVKLNNTEVKEPNERIGTSSIGTEWWAVVENCDNLQYSPSENRIIANAMPGETLHIQYITVEQGQFGPVILATAGHVDIRLTETEDGQTELLTLYASEGIDYKDNGNRFIGSELLFEREKSLVTVAGDDTQPCYFNGSLVDGIKYNLKTGKVKAQVVGPGALRMNRQ